VLENPWTNSSFSKENPMASHVDRDERTLAVEGASYRWAYHFVSFGLLLLAVYRSGVRNEAAWDLLALAVLGGVVASGYQWLHQVLTRRWLVRGMLTLVVAALVAALVVWMRT
jgi:hypothetical protein